MMVAVAARGARETVDGPSVVRERLEEFVGEVALASMDHPVQRENAGRYVRGLLQAGPRNRLNRWSSGGRGRLPEPAAVPGRQPVGSSACDAGGG